MDDFVEYRQVVSSITSSVESNCKLNQGASKEIKCYNVTVQKHAKYDVEYSPGKCILSASLLRIKIPKTNLVFKKMDL